MSMNFNNISMAQQTLISEAVVLEQTFNASVEKVWKAITNRDDMAQWYFNMDEFEPEVGFKTQFNVHHDGRDYLHIWKVTEVISLKKISYEWRLWEYPGNSLLTMELEANGDKTKLKLTHEKLETFKPGIYPDMARENFVAGWTRFIGTALKEFLEK